MPQLFSNSARALLLSGITNVSTSLSVAVAEADLFPTANTGTNSVPATTNWFKAVLEDSAGNREVVYVRTRTAGSGTMSNVLRGQEGTTARSFDAGATLGLRVTATDMEYTVAGALTSADRTKLDGIEADRITQLDSAVAVVDDNQVNPSRVGVTLDGTEVLRVTRGSGGAATITSPVTDEDLTLIATGSGSDLRLYGGSVRLYGYPEIRFFSNDQNAMRVTATGLGIGTTTPSVPLEVNGKATIRRDSITNTIANGVSGNEILEIAQNTGGGAALIKFHRNGQHWQFFGLDTDNRFKHGGLDAGANAYQIYSDKRVTISTAAASGTADQGDLWIQVF